MSDYTIYKFYSEVDDVEKYEVKREGKYLIGYTLTRVEALAVAELDNRQDRDED